MVNVEFAKMLARKIYKEEINPNTGVAFVIGDIKKEEYIEPVKDFIEQFKEKGECIK